MRHFDLNNLLVNFDTYESTLGFFAFIAKYLWNDKKANITLEFVNEPPLTGTMDFETNHATFT